MIEIGTLDMLHVLFGEKKTGKSTLAKLQSTYFQRSTGGFVIGHSPNGQIGWAPDIEFHDSLTSLDRGVRKRPAMKHFLADGGTPEDVIDYGRALALALRKQGHKKAGEKFHPHRPAKPGVLAAPVLTIVDEGTHTQQVDTKWRKPGDDDGSIGVIEKRELEKLLTSLRHENLAIIYLIQTPTARAWIYTEQATAAFTFRYSHEYGRNAIRAAGFIPKEEMPAIALLPNFEYYQFEKSNPWAAGYRKLPPPE